MMARRKEYTIRPSQIIHTFGPGSIYDGRDDSFLIMGIDHWKRENCRVIRDDALRQHMVEQGHTALRDFLVPSKPDDDDDEYDQVAIKTFPRWGRCPNCNMLQERKGVTYCINTSCKDEHGKSPKVRPVRFVAVCINGHLEDFPWYRWVHRDPKGGCKPEQSRLFLNDRSDSASLKSLSVECKTCGMSQPMTAALSPGGLRFLGTCRGKRPWLRGGDVECVDAGDGVYMRGIYKGASNFYFGDIVRAITIPPHSSDLAREIMALDETHNLLDNAAQTSDEILAYLFKHKRKPTDVRHMIKSIKEGRESPHGIRSKEFIELNNSRYPDVGTDHGHFKTEPVEVPREFSEYLSNVVLVRKLREVIILRGFYRLEPGAYGDARRRSEIGARRDWLPAVENMGEGLFFSLHNGKIARWEKRDDVVRRFKKLGKANPLSDNEVTPRYALLHGISHMMIKEISNYAGYSALSLRERIYSGPDMAGILIYTSSSSNDGSLGGLIEQGRHPKFAMIFNAAMSKAGICSMDPLCSTPRPASAGRSGGSACHACLYLPETSCESSNTLLDRAMVGGTLSGEGIGFFEG